MLSGSVFAADPTIFTGKYSLSADENCELASSSDNKARVYIYTKRHSYHNNLLSLNIDIYSDDASGEVIVIENGTHQTVGTSVDSHDKVTDTIKTKWAANKKLIVEVRTVRPSINLDYTKVNEISLNAKNDLVIKQFIKNRPDQSKSTCIFKR